jgi:hypothetical protein
MGSRAKFSTQSLSVEQIIVGVADAASGQVRGENTIALFMELGARLASEGWPIKMALEIIHAYPVAVWNELGSHFSEEEDSPTEGENKQVARKSLEAEEMHQLYQQINSWVKWLVEGYVVQKESHITKPSEELVRAGSAQDLQFQAACLTAKSACHHISQPLTVINVIASLAEDGSLEQDEVAWFQEAVKQAALVLDKLRNLKRYSIIAQTQNDFILDLDTSSEEDLFENYLSDVKIKHESQDSPMRTQPENEFSLESWQTLDYDLSF